MRILHVVTAFPRTPDDVIVPWLVELLKRLQAAGHEVEVFTSSYRGAPDQVFAGIPVHRFRYFPRRWENLTHEEAAPDRMKRSLLYRLMPACFVLAGMVAIWRLCRRARYDVIHVHWPLPLALFGWAAQRARPARLVTTFYGVELRWVKSALPFLKGFLAWAARRSDRVVAISHYTAGELRELADVPIEVIPYTTSLPEVGATSPAPDGKGPVLFVGRLVEREAGRRDSGHRGGWRVGPARSAGGRRCAGGSRAAAARRPRLGPPARGGRPTPAARAVQLAGNRAAVAGPLRGARDPAPLGSPATHRRGGRIVESAEPQLVHLALQATHLLPQTGEHLPDQPEPEEDQPR